MLRRIVWGCATQLAFVGVAAADPVPVIPHGVGDAVAGEAAVQRVADAVGGDAMRGDALRSAIEARFGRFAPGGDTLEAQRTAIASAWDAYFRSGPRGARRRLSDAVTAMEAAPDALALREENRAAYLRALGMLARIDLEARHESDAERWVRAALRLDPSWSPPARDFPPPVQQLVARLRGGAAATGEGRLSVRLPREGCTASVDGNPLPGAGRVRTLAVPAGSHRVSAVCDAPSRVRTVSVAAGATVEVAIDPERDGRLRLTGSASLGYASARDQDAMLGADAAAIGQALGASQVIAVSSTRVRVIDVARAQSLGELDASRGDLAEALRALRDGRSAAAATAAASPPTPHPAGRTDASGVGAGPWVLVGGGAALAAVGVLFWVLRSDAYDALVARCPLADGVPACPDGPSQQLGAEERDRANLMQGLAIGSWAAGGVAITSGLLWYALGGRRSERVSLSASTRGGSLTLRW